MTRNKFSYVDSRCKKQQKEGKGKNWKTERINLVLVWVSYQKQTLRRQTFTIPSYNSLPFRAKYCFPARGYKTEPRPQDGNLIVKSNKANGKRSNYF